MPDPLAQMIEVGAGAARRRIAVLSREGRAPGLVWLAGFKSDMISTKASALDGWAAARGLACTRFDYSGHGQSGGRFEDGTIGRWLEETVAVLARETHGSQILVGSSMGGYLALLALRHLMDTAPDEAGRIAALLLVAPAWDMTEELMWRRFPESARRAIETDGVWLRPSQYGDPYPITRRLIEDGRRHLIGREAWKPGRPVHILHGLLDPDVPWEHSLDLASQLDGPDIEVEAVPDGEHRLSRPEDIERMLAMLGGLVDRVKA